MNGASNRLSSLPQELMDDIMGYLHPLDVLALRWTCRACRKKTFDLVAKTFFQDRRVSLMSEKSLLNMIASLDHAILGPMLRSITIFIDDYRQGSRRAKDAAVFKANNEGMQLLTTVFKKFDELGLHPKIAVTSGGFKRTSTGKSPVSKSMIVPEATEFTGFTTVIDALMHSIYLPHHFSVNKDRPFKEEWYLPIHSIVRNQSLGFYQQTSMNLRSLSVDAWVKTSDAAWRETCDFFQCISSCTNLESLSVYVRDSGDKPLQDLKPCNLYIAAALFCHDYPALQSLKLWNAYMDMQKAVNFLRRHQQIFSLKKFSMGYITVDFDNFDEHIDATDGLTCEGLAELAGVEVEDCEEE